MDAIVRLSSEYEFGDFDCSDTDLNDFLLNDSKNYQKELLGVTYIAEKEGEIVAYFTMLNDKISVEVFPTGSAKKRATKSIPYPKRSLKSFPAVKLGRLGVSVKFQGQGIGKSLINYIAGYFVDNNRTGCKYITVDAYANSLAFYQKMGFDFMTDLDAQEETRQMYFPLNPMIIERL